MQAGAWTASLQVHLEIRNHLEIPRKLSSMLRDSPMLEALRVPKARAFPNVGRVKMHFISSLSLKAIIMQEFQQSSLSATW